MGIREHITPDRIANAIRQDKSYQGTYLIVEGKSDYWFYTKFIDQKVCQVQIAYGCLKVITVINNLEQTHYQQALGIIDADFRRLENETLLSDNILMTDVHDLETMIIQSPAFEQVIESYYVKERYEAFIAKKQDDLRNILLQLAKPIAYLKWINKIYDYGLLFKPQKETDKPLDYTKFIEKNNLTFKGYDELIKTVINYTINKIHPQKLTLSQQDILDKIKLKEMEGQPDLWQLCNGHDLTNLIAIALLKAISSYNAKAVAYTEIERNLILAYDSFYFKSTNLLISIKNWEKQQPDRKILSEMFD
ncbi:cytoplasmic protein [Beggiatoa sp. PS]|nr:cytoplasmic protein [Beggiatoa sp. PS]